MSDIKEILSKYKSIAMIGVSNDPTKASTIVMKYMQKYGFKVFPVNPKAKGQKILGEEVYEKITDIKDISMASPNEVKMQTGYTIGGVSPVGHNNKVEILIDNSLERFINLYAAAGHPNCIFKINFNNLQKITNGKVKEIIE